MSLNEILDALEQDVGGMLELDSTSLVPVYLVGIAERHGIVNYDLLQSPTLFVAFCPVADAPEGYVAVEQSTDDFEGLLRLDSGIILPGFLGHLTTHNTTPYEFPGDMVTFYVPEEVAD